MVSLSECGVFFRAQSTNGHPVDVAASATPGQASDPSAHHSWPHGAFILARRLAGVEAEFLDAMFCRFLPHGCRLELPKTTIAGPQNAKRQLFAYRDVAPGMRSGFRDCINIRFEHGVG